MSAAIYAVLFYFTRPLNHHVYEQPVREIQETFSNPSEITEGPKLTGCKYLRARIDEALRVSPPIEDTLLREQTSPSSPGENNSLWRAKLSLAAYKLA